MIGRSLRQLFRPAPGGRTPVSLPLLELAQFDGRMTRTVLEGAMRARCQTVVLDEQTVLARVLGRYKFLVDRRDLGLAPHLMLDGYWEYWATELVVRHLRPGDTAFDIGAHVGYYAVLMADLVGKDGRVHAVEPNPRLALLAERNLALNGFTGHATMHRAAASDMAGDSLLFRSDPADPKNGRLLGRQDGTALPGAMESIVPSIRLDDLTPGPAHFIKVDVEGAEAAVWAGMQGLLDRSPDVLLLLEFNAGRCIDPAALIASMAARFPLRSLDLDARVSRADPAVILAQREDTMLVLTNRVMDDDQPSRPRPR